MFDEDIHTWLQDNRCLFDDWLLSDKNLIKALIEGAVLCLKVGRDEGKRLGDSKKSIQWGIRQISGRIEHELNCSMHYIVLLDGVAMIIMM